MSTNTPRPPAKVTAQQPVPPKPSSTHSSPQPEKTGSSKSFPRIDTPLEFTRGQELVVPGYDGHLKAGNSLETSGSGSRTYELLTEDGEKTPYLASTFKTGDKVVFDTRVKEGDQKKSVNLADPEQMLKHYYQLINDDELQKAYALRSSRSRGETNLDKFKSTWSNNNTIAADSFAVKNRSGRNRCEVAFQLTANDTNRKTGVASTTVYQAVVKLVYENDAWRYDGGNFSAKSSSEKASSLQSSGSKLGQPAQSANTDGPFGKVTLFYERDGAPYGPAQTNLWAGFNFIIQVDLNGLDASRSHELTFDLSWENSPGKWRSYEDHPNRRISIPRGRSTYRQRWVLSPLIGIPWFSIGMDKIEIRVDGRLVETHLYHRGVPPENIREEIGRPREMYYDRPI